MFRRGGPTKDQVLGALRPTMGNTVGLTTRFSGRYPIKVSQVDGFVPHTQVVDLKHTPGGYLDQYEHVHCALSAKVLPTTHAVSYAKTFNLKKIWR